MIGAQIFYETLVLYSADVHMTKGCEKCQSARSEEAQSTFGSDRPREKGTEMLESPASCFAFRYGASLDMTASRLMDLIKD
jgi:hypothetical protein